MRVLKLLSILTVFIGINIGNVMAESDDPEKAASMFIQELSQSALSALIDPDASREVRVERFRTLFKDRFAVRSIGKFVLGRNWRKASNDERKEYLRLFEDLMVVSYVDQFQRYTGSGLKVLKTRLEKGNAATVFSEINRPKSTQKIGVIWRVGHKNSIYKILDVIVAGTSMSNTLRHDFASIINRNGGQVSALIKELSVKTKSLKQTAID